MSEQSEIAAQNRANLEATKPNPMIRDDRGPLVYDRTFTPSLNGIDPAWKDLPGGGPNPRGNG